jgi:ABC-2 type transport system permease protein
MATTTIAIPAATRPRRTRNASAVRTLASRRLALTVRSPRSLVAPLLTPVLFALVIAPALANSLASPGQRTSYMTYIALATAGLLIPLNCMFSGIGVVVDREHGAMRELLVAPIRRSAIVAGNLVAAIATTALQMAVLIAASALRGAAYQTGRGILWFAGAALVFSVVMYGVAEIVASRVPSPEAYIGVLPAIAIVPFFFAGSLFPITSLPSWLADVAKILPLTHALALFRYGLTPANGGAQALHSIWGMSNGTTMAALSMLVVGLYAVALMAGAIRLFTKQGTS